MTTIEAETIIETIAKAFKNLNPPAKYQAEINEILTALEIYDSSFDECVRGLNEFAKKAHKEKTFKEILDHIRLYNIDEPFVALASNYGVPQNRERVLFIGCRKGQKLIKEIPTTVAENEKVSVFEALHDLDFIGNGDEKTTYEEVNLKAKYNGTTRKNEELLLKEKHRWRAKSRGGLNLCRMVTKETA